MKICAIICEYNPFHNGHLYQLNAARELSGADAVLCIMSGNFTQRGEAAITDKYSRARHALQAGADIVLELPTVFATSNAELFAKGAIKVLASIPSVQTLCFGAENADKPAFLLGARYLNKEPKEISDKIKEEVSKGTGYAKARANAWEGFIPFDLLCSPNNILGLEYTKAILSADSHIEILPVRRTGSGYLDKTLKENYSSATAIRAGIENGIPLTGNLPEFVLKDLPSSLKNKLELLEKYAILSRSKKEIAKTCDCTEGLENALKKVAETNEPLISSLTSARYTSSRIRRIALQNLLKIDEALIRNSLRSPLYLRVLGVKKTRSEMLSVISESPFPILVRAHDEDVLTDVAKLCHEKDVFAEKIYDLLYEKTKAEKNIFI